MLRPEIGNNNSIALAVSDTVDLIEAAPLIPTDAVDRSNYLTALYDDQLDCDVVWKICSI